MANSPNNLHTEFGTHDQTPSDTDNGSTTDAQEISLIQYPSAFPIKIMGHKTDGFIEAIVAVAKLHDPSFDATSIELRDSASGNYLGITITVTATSRQMLDDLYRELTAHPMVKVVL